LRHTTAAWSSSAEEELKGPQMASDMDKAIQENMKFTLELADKIPLSAATSVELRRFLVAFSHHMRLTHIY
jgi:C4-type Zn-finger protein